MARDLESTTPAARDHRASKIGKTILDVGKTVIMTIWEAGILVILVICVPIVILYKLFVSASNDNTFLVSSFVGVSLDPLFLYIPLIDKNNKCLMLDKGLKITALILRTITDLRYIPRMLIRRPGLEPSSPSHWPGTPNSMGHEKKGPALLMDGESEESSMIREKVLNLVIDVTAVLPIPQVVILIFLPNMRGSKSLNIMKGLNLLLVLQYMARSYPIYKFCMQLNKMKLQQLSKSENQTEKRRVGKYVDKVMSFPGALPKLWIPGVVNFIMYIIASHVFGAFWYFLSIQREMDCWKHACKSQNGCEFTSHCANNMYRNVKKEVCPTNPPNATAFDFGVYAYPLQFLAQESTDFSEKLLICFSWGLRNLSSFASNLNANSTYRWENFFVLIVSILGLVFFIYLIGHLQATNRSDRLRLKMKEIIEPLLTSLISDLPAEMLWKIRSEVKENIEDNEDLIEANILSILSLISDPQLVKEIKHSLFVKKLQNKVEEPLAILKIICEHLEPLVYTEESYIIRQGEPLDKLFFITQGIVLTYQTSKESGESRTIQLEKPDNGLYGEELLTWAETKPNGFSKLPISSITVKVHKKVEVFALKAADLQCFYPVRRFR